MDVGLSGGVDPDIHYNMSFSEWEAAVTCGLDLWRWVNNRYPLWFKTKVVAFHRLRGLVKAHTEEAIAKAAKRKGKKDGA